jgi:hypothetical protein
MRIIIGSGSNTTFQPATDVGAPSRIVVGTGGGVTELVQLTDVDASNVANGEVLTYISASDKFEMRPISDIINNDTANAAYNQANSARNQANSAYQQANLAYAAANVANNGANTVHIYANGTSVLPNSTLNFNNTATINVAAAANGVLQTNVAFNLNVSSLGLTNYVLKAGDTMTGNLNVNASLNVSKQIYANTVEFPAYELASNTFSTNSNLPIEVDSFAASAYSTVKYIVQVKSVNNIHSTELLCIQDGLSTYMTEYATLISSHPLGYFSVDLLGSRVSLNFIPDNPLGDLMTFKVVRYTIAS